MKSLWKIALGGLLLSQLRPAFVDWLAKINALIDYQEQKSQATTPLAPEARAAKQPG